MHEIPGVVPVPGREFRYLRCNSKAEFDRMFDALDLYEGERPPQSGGMITENAVLRTPTGESYFGVSYKGDLEGWRRLIDTYCSAEGVRSALVVNGSLQIDGSPPVAVSDCDVSFY